MKLGVVFSLSVLVACEQASTRTQVTVDLSNAVKVLRQAQTNAPAAGATMPGETGETGADATNTMPADGATEPPRVLDTPPEASGDAGIIPDALPGASTGAEEKRSTFVPKDPTMTGYLIRFDAWCTESDHWTIQRETFFSLDEPEALAELEPCGAARLWVTVFHVDGEPIAALSGYADVMLVEGDQEVTIITDKIGELDVGLLADAMCDLQVVGPDGTKSEDTILPFQPSRFYLLPGQYELACDATNRLGEKKLLTGTAQVNFAERTIFTWEPASMGMTPGGNMTGDTMPPEIGAVLVKNLTQIGATIDWATSEDVACGIEVSRDANFNGIDRAQATPRSFMHTASFSGLMPDQTYYFRIACTDAATNIGSYKNFFDTPPVMMNVLNITGELMIPQHTLPRSTVTHTFVVDFDDNVTGLSSANFAVTGPGIVITGVSQQDSDTWNVVVTGLAKGNVYTISVLRNFTSVNGRELAMGHVHGFKIEDRIFVDAGTFAFGDGLTPATAFATLFEAVGVATAGDAIVATVGDYDLGVSTLDVPANVRLIGGYKDLSYTVRDLSPVIGTTGPTTPTTRFSYVHSASAQGVFAVSGITHTATEIDGFYINSDANSPGSNYAITVANSAQVRIANNLIYGPSPGATSTSATIKIFGGNANIFNNVISAGCATSTSATASAINVSGGGAKIIGNTIYLGTLNGCSFATSSSAIVFNNTTTPRIIDNLFFISGTNFYAVRESNPANAAAFQDNYFLLNNAAKAYLDDGSTDRADASAIDNIDSVAPAYSGNHVDIAIAAGFFTEVDGGDNSVLTLHDNDWRPLPMGVATAVVRSAGQTTVGEICFMGPCTDLMGQPRTLTGGFSIGAYEVD